MAVRYVIAGALVLVGVDAVWSAFHQWETVEILIDVAGALSAFMLAGLVATWDR